VKGRFFKPSVGTPGKGEAKWLTTFNDLITLLMVFFVLLFSTSRLDVKKMKEFQKALQSGLGVLLEGSESKVRIVEEGRGIVRFEHNEGKRAPFEGSFYQTGSDVKLVEAVKDFMRRLRAQWGPGHGILATATPEGVVVTLENTILFDTGKARIKPSGIPKLEAVRLLLLSVPNRVRIEGHTDNVPIHTPRFPSNWELSTARAVNVLKYFLSRGELAPERFSAVGYGDTKPIATNDSPEGRARNRRVEIVLER